MDIDILFVIGVLLLFNVKTFIFGILIIGAAYFLRQRKPARRKRKNIDMDSLMKD